MHMLYGWKMDSAEFKALADRIYNKLKKKKH